MKLALLIFLACIWAAPSSAQQSVNSLCRELSTYMPITGVDFNPGASEVPATLNAVQDPVYGSISIPVEIDLAEHFNLPNLKMTPGMDLKPDVANIEINRDGSVFYNGQEISANIQRLCGTPVPMEKDVVSRPNPPPVKAKPKPKPRPKPQPKPQPKLKPAPKPKAEVKPAPVPVLEPAVKKSSVKVFNGPKTVIADEPKIKSEPKMIIRREVKAAKPKTKAENAIDVEVLNAQDNKDEVINGDGDDDSILEGQYP